MAAIVDVRIRGRGISSRARGKVASTALRVCGYMCKTSNTKSARGDNCALEGFSIVTQGRY